MNEKHLTQLRKITRILYVFGASLLLAAMVLGMVNIPVKAADSDGDGYNDSWDPCPNDYNNTCEIIWCHCMPNGQCNTISPSINALISNGNGGHIDASGNILHAGDHSGACVVNTGVPTQEPTQDPTQVPTGVPTRVPTNVPTQVPTEVPTQVPTDVPTQVPTDVPTQVPTNVPTQVPTDVPTQVPTNVPTQVPTEVPTQVPTNVPTQMPTEVPPVDPTQQPTDNPPQDPTDVPPGDPTQQPPQDPTKQPPDNPPQDPPQDPNPPAGVLIPVTGVDIGGNVIPFARSLTMNLSILFFGMAMVLQAVTYRISKNH